MVGLCPGHPYPDAGPLLGLDAAGGPEQGPEQAEGRAGPPFRTGPPFRAEQFRFMKEKEKTDLRGAVREGGDVEGEGGGLSPGLSSM